jgi:predicted nuclease of predicted toxin-antitoxin system
MKFKLDENFGSSALTIFRERGHDAQGVLDEGLSGCTDSAIFETCIAEERCLVTLDLDFADVIRFPPAGTHGIAVVRAPKGQHSAFIGSLLNNLLDAINVETIHGSLWIVEAGRIRIRSGSS